VRWRPRPQAGLSALLVRRVIRSQQGQLLLVLDQAQVRAECELDPLERDKDKLTTSAFEFLASQGAASGPAARRVEGPISAVHGSRGGREATLAFSNLRAPISGRDQRLQVETGRCDRAGAAINQGGAPTTDDGPPRCAR